MTQTVADIPIKTQSTKTQSTKTQSTKPQPTWEVAQLFPTQGEWSVEEYLALDSNRLIEFADGKIEVLTMPTPKHQSLVFYLQLMLWTLVQKQKLGKVLAAPLSVELWANKFREPDVIYVSQEKLANQPEGYWRNVDLVMEVVSPDNPNRDYKTKRKEYERAKIQEYWIVDPQKNLITVHTLHANGYQLHGEFRPGEQASSLLLKDFTLDVTELFSNK